MGTTSSMNSTNLNLVDHTKLLSLAGKSALITGAAGALGRYFSAAFAHAGADLILLEKDLTSVQELAEELTKQTQRKIRAISCDLADPEAIKRTLPSAIAEFQPSILLNNAASKGPNIDRFFDPPAQFSPDIWREIMAVNLDAMFWVAQLVVDPLISRKMRGSVIQVSSIYGVVAPDQRIYEGSDYNGRAINTPAIYSASKGGVIALTRYLATYWGQHGIRVNTLTPGGIYNKGQNETFVNRYSQRVPLGRMGEPEDLIGALLFLASDASNYVTGQNLVVDGGLSAW